MAEVVLAAATVLAVAAVAVALPAVLRAPAERAVRTRLTPALVILTGGAVISFAAYLAFSSRCGHRCERGAGTRHLLGKGLDGGAVMTKYMRPLQMQSLQDCLRPYIRIAILVTANPGAEA